MAARTKYNQGFKDVQLTAVNLSENLITDEEITQILHPSF